ncbi:MAG TPA: GNAT family protein [Gaiellales bacterium]
MATPPYRIETDRLLLRCWNPGDAPLLEDAVTSSLPELSEWMPWVHDEPISIDRRIELLRGFRAQFDSGEDAIYGIFSPDGSRVLGGTGLHPRGGLDALEIGYWIRTDATGQRLAEEAAAALTRAGLRICGVDRMEIRVDPRNERSARIPERLGYRREALLRRRLPPTAPGRPRSDVLLFTMFSDGFEGTPAAAVPIRAFDAAGRPVAAG